MLFRLGALALACGSIFAVSAQRVCVSSSNGGCESPACPGGDFEAVDNCIMAIAPDADCPTGCSPKSIEGLDAGGLCVVTGFESGDIPQAAFETAAAECSDTEFEDIGSASTGCLNALADIFSAIGCTEACFSELTRALDACADVTGDCSSEPAHSCDGVEVGSGAAASIAGAVAAAVAAVSALMA